MKPPAQVTVGPHRHTVDVNRKRCQDTDIAFGRFDRVMGGILINPDQSPDAMADSLLHETIHAICDVQSCQAGGTAAIFADEDHEERFVRAFAPLLLDTLRRNPDLVAFLLRPTDAD